MSTQRSNSRDRESKRIRRIMRELAYRAYEVELHHALEPLSESFDQWKQGQVTSEVLSELIHQFHQGAARDIFARYEIHEPAVARAIAKGILARSTISAEILEYLSASIKYFEAGIDEM